MDHFPGFMREKLGAEKRIPSIRKTNRDRKSHHHVPHKGDELGSPHPGQ